MSKYIELHQQKWDGDHQSPPFLRQPKNFNWKVALLSEEPEWKILQVYASSWVTCACGHQCEVIPRNHIGAPEDPVLELLGKMFLSDIKYQNVKKALETLEAIEERSKFLINEIQNG